MKASRGFTLVELMIYAGLTAMIVGLFGAILITILRVQGEQTSSTQVGTELSFIMTTIKRHIHEAADAPTVDTDSVEIEKSDDSMITIEYNDAEKSIFITDSALDATEKINSDRISIDRLEFTQLQDPQNPSSTAIQITMTASASTTNPADEAIRTLQGTASPFLQSQ